jgi:hypothetical protein
VTGRTWARVAGAAMVVLCGATAAAQQSVRIEVRDDLGAPVGFALVALVGGASQVATDSGVAMLRTRAADSLNLRVRRIGYREHFGWVRRRGSDAFEVRLPRIAASLATVEVTAAGSSSNTPLMQRGFYDRVDRVQKGAILADFFTPEQLDEREGFTKVTQMIAGSRYARVNSMTFDRGAIRRLVVVGRGGCPMTILLDGYRVAKSAQDYAISEIPQSIDPNGSQLAIGNREPAPPSIDDVVDGRSIMAIEIYPSTGNAPFELQRASGRGSCGIVALWTGARR